MSKEPVIMLSYDEKNFKALMFEYKGLLTFTDVASWDQRARAEVEQIINAIGNVNQKLTDATGRFEQAKKERAQKNFISRLFAGKVLEQSHTLLMQKYDTYRTRLEEFASQLQEAIDFTPNSRDEQTSLLKELKSRKEELQVEKREAAAAMKAVRREARQQSTEVGITHSYSPKLVASQRRVIRYQKESALGPHEDLKTSIERQLIQVDRDILWAEKFT